MTGQIRTLRELDPAQALRLLASVPYGRVVFTSRALPAIRPVNHLVDDGHVIIRTNHGTAITSAVEHRAARRSPTVVAFQADSIDPVTRLGWSVVVTGQAIVVTDAAQIARYAQHLEPWLDATMDTVISISCDIVSGYEMVCEDIAHPAVTGQPAGSSPSHTYADVNDDLVEAAFGPTEGIA